ncbi:protein kinase C substrate 80K-H [Cryptococcus neoformans A1-35-8]|nr:protein kinase C substrate 80K-H [Cryptococcus neoformans var. grubii A5-35-17]OXH20409.1 protein kinase C substrate 80K-H [Cryptococcus neoformans var. grubii A1-35-8]
MKDSTIFITLLSSLLLFTLVTFAAQEEQKVIVPSQIRGLNPGLYDKYEPTKSGLFHCLDSSKTIPFSAINDDYCDCPDGSDEPGTAACSNGLFWCKNEGHIPGSVRKSRVNDGLCEPECCDGSDEWATGACPNNCEAIGREWRAAKEASEKVRKTGAKIRGTYIRWAQGEKKRLEEDLVRKRQELTAKEEEVAKAKAILDKTETRSQEDLERKKQSPVYISLLSHRLALARLRSKTSSLEAEIESLHSLLREMAKGYNPNYQDMAVKAAVVGYEELTGIKYREGESEGEMEVKKEENEEDDKEEEITEEELEALEKEDLEALLLSDTTDGEEEDEEDDGTSLLWKLDEYIPDSLYGSWEHVRDVAIDWMIRFGLAGRSKAKTSSGDGPQVAAAREKHRLLNNELVKLNGAIRDTEDTIKNMEFHYGPEGEWKKLDRTCVDKVVGDYTYELCFFGKATQKSNKDKSSNNLGSFNQWNTAADQGSFGYYSQQLYKNGPKCWNGPNRSVTVDLSCGTSNALISVSEPEKCEYRFKVTSPALCWPDVPGSPTDEMKVKEEL